MKVPDVLFVKHVPSLNPERKKFLLEHLKDRVQLNDIRWCEDYNFDHPFVEWLNKAYRLPYGVKLTSNFVKTLYSLKEMVDENIESALFIDDDVAFHKDWAKIIESVKLPDNVLFVNMGTTNFIQDAKPVVGKAYVLPNNGGCEVSWCSLEFAREFLDSINLLHTSDIIVHGFLYSKGHPIINIPIAYQTSGLENNTSLDHDTRREGHWVDYVKNYKIQTTFTQLLSEYELFLKLKKQKEQKIFELYGKQVDIKNIEYVLGRSGDYCNDILKFQ